MSTLLIPGVGLVNDGTTLYVAGAGIVEQAATGPATFSGTGAVSLPLATAAGAAKKERKGTGAPSLLLITASGAAAKTRKGTGAPSLPLVTASGAAKKERKGTGAPNLLLITASGSGSSVAAGVFAGTGAVSLPLLTVSSTAKRGLLGTGAPTLPLVTATGAAVGPQVAAEEQPSGGWAAYNAYDAERQRRKRRKLDEEEAELEAEADRLEMLLAAEGKVQPSEIVQNRYTVREYAPQAAEFTRRTQRAIDYALRAQSEAAYQLAARQIEMQLQDEELALLLLLAAA